MLTTARCYHDWAIDWARAVFTATSLHRQPTAWSASVLTCHFQWCLVTITSLWRAAQMLMRQPTVTMATLQLQWLTRGWFLAWKSACHLDMRKHKLVSYRKVPYVTDRQQTDIRFGVSRSSEAHTVFTSFTSHRSVINHCTSIIGYNNVLIVLDWKKTHTVS